VSTFRHEDVIRPVTEICEVLGLDPKNVRHIEMEPSMINVTVYAKNEDGKYINPATGGLAVEQFTFYRVSEDVAE
jgi:hypothetical protein